MALSLTHEPAHRALPTVEENVPLDPLEHLQRKPIKSTGLIDAFPSFDVTPTIGREFPTANLKEWLHAPNSDDLLRDLALTVSQRGVVFFRKQDDLDNELQKELVQRLGLLSGKPSTSGLHIHPVHNSEREDGVPDDLISVISSHETKKLSKDSFRRKQSEISQWHSDMTCEPVPADYSALRLTEIPKSGGDTLWASGYELYDRLSEPYQKLLEGLTATCASSEYSKIAQTHGFKLHPGPRGAPENIGTEMQAIHPVVRTNPVTGWKSVFTVGHQVTKINEVTGEESDHLLYWFLSLVVDNPDLQVRLRWQSPNDLAIWDNRCTYHAATFDYEGPRIAHRVIGIGEKPYLDPRSTSRRAALAHDE